MERRVVHTRALIGAAAITRRVRFRGLDRLVRTLHHPDHSNFDLESIVTLKSGVRMHVNLASFIEWSVFFYGGYEQATCSLWPSLLADGGSAIDVGANVGVHTLAMAAVTAAPVVACEPQPAVHRRLCSNLALNGFSHVRALQVAVSDITGTVELHVPRVDSNRGTASLRPLGGGRSESIQVQARTLDDVADGLDVSVIKVDVEGWEAAVLKSGSSLLAAQLPALVFEHDAANWSAAGHAFEEVVSQLTECGYRRWRLVGNRGLIDVDPSSAPDGNMLVTVA